MTVQLINPGPNGIFGDGDDIITSTTTLPDGSYQFDGVQPGNYRVRELDPAGFTSTTPNLVSIALPPGGSASANFGDKVTQAPTNVDIASFMATVDDGQVRVEWQTVTEIETLGFNVWRSRTPQGTYEQVNPELIPSQALGTIGTAYSYVDASAASGTWYYRLEVVNSSGETLAYGPVSVQVGLLGQFKLYLPFLVKAR